jgi:type VI secretion system secreted protein VgrG
MEVVVNFLDGDPDQPIITGTVYGAHRQPPWPLPADKSKSGIVSSWNANPGNEISFEDAPGCEEIYVRAQKNLRTWVKDSHQHEVLGSQSISVDGSRRTRIGRSDSLNVGGQRDIVVHGSHDASPTANTSTFRVVHGSHTMTVERGWLRQLLQEGGWALDVLEGDASIHVVEGTHSVRVTKGNSNTVIERGDSTLSVAEGSHRVTVHGDAIHEVHTGNFAVYAADQGCLLAAKKSIVLQSGDSSIVLSPEGIEIRGPKLTFVGAQEALLEGDSVTVRGKWTLVAADGQTTIKGAPIHLNPPG